MRRVERGAFAAAALRSGLEAIGWGRDRGLATDLVYGTLRHLPYLEAALAPRLRAPQRLPSEVRWALRVAAYELLVRGTARHAAVHSWVGVVAAAQPQLAGLVNAVLRRLEPPPAPDAATELRLPAWLLRAFETSLADAAAAAASAMLEPEPLWIVSYHPAAVATLEREGCTLEPGPVADSYRLRTAKPLSELEAFRAGMIQPQNPTSAAVVQMLGPPAGATVYDLAGGNGIKAAQLARRGAAVLSVERDAGKIAAARRNLARLGLEVEHLRHDLSQAPALGPAPYVLLDAPCSGTGTLRGHPEIKLRLTPAAVAGLAELQTRLLDTAAQLTAPRGTLLYAVCSLLPDEGHRQIERLLERHPDFAAEPLGNGLDAVATPVGSYLLPLDGRDGFFLARLRRDAPP